MYEDKHQTLYRILAAALFVLICAGMMIYAHLKSPPEPVDAANWRRVEMLKTEVFSRIRAPWDKDRQSIHSFLRSFEREAGSGPLPEAAMVLPDEEAFNARWRDGSPDAARPGSLDTAYISLDVTGGDEAGAISEKLCRQLRAVMERPNSRTVADMHESLLALDSLIPYIDAMREVAQEPVPNEAFLYEYGEWLVKECPDRNPVKLGIILRGLFNRAGYSAIFTLARHDEFTLFALHAQSANLQNTPVYEDAVWTMAKRVKGWGRVQAVLRLFDTENPEIRKWLLREGYANEVDIAILAFGCAQTGGLLRELEAEAIDAETAKSIGLVQDVVPVSELMDRVLEIAVKIGQNAPIAVRQCKSVINAARYCGLEEALALEVEATRACYLTEDKIEGVKAFVDKRKAVFYNR